MAAPPRAALRAIIRDMTPRGRFLVALVTTALLGYVFVGSVLSRVLGDSTYGQLAIFNEVVRLVLDAYVEPVNIDRTMAGARQGLTEALDGDSAYLESEDFRLYQQGPKDADADVGLLLSRRFTFIQVVSVRGHSPAEKAGVKAGDILKTIDGRHTRPLAAAVGQRLLRGAPGSMVKLAVLRAGNDPLEFSLVRERLLPAPPKGRLLEPGVGYLKLVDMPARSADEVKAELEGLRRSGARKLVLDLRGVSLGTPAEAVHVAELFMKGGVVTKLSSTRQPEQVFSAESAKTAWDWPMATLVDYGTSGPGEILAAALLESDRSPLVGRRTYGRAAVQKAVPLEEGGLVITVAKYVSPKGNALHGKGVEPSVVVGRSEEDDEPESETPSATDPFIEKALELLKAEAKKAA
jgi:carboxyl-terminal processing protease